MSSFSCSSSTLSAPTVRARSLLERCSPGRELDLLRMFPSGDVGAYVAWDGIGVGPLQVLAQRAVEDAYPDTDSQDARVARQLVEGALLRAQKAAKAAAQSSYFWPLRLMRRQLSYYIPHLAGHDNGYLLEATKLDGWRRSLGHYKPYDCAGPPSSDMPLHSLASIDSKSLIPLWADRTKKVEVDSSASAPSSRSEDASATASAPESNTIAPPVPTFRQRAARRLAQNDELHPLLSRASTSQ